MDRERLVQELRRLAPWHFDMEIRDGLRTVEGNCPEYGDDDKNRVSSLRPEGLEPLIRNTDLHRGLQYISSRRLTLAVSASVNTRLILLCTPLRVGGL